MTQENTGTHEMPIVEFKSGRNALGQTLYWFELSERTIEHLQKQVQATPEGARRMFLVYADMVEAMAQRIREELADGL